VKKPGKTRKQQEPEDYKFRGYRLQVAAPGLVSFRVTVRETDLHIMANRDLTAEARHLVLQARSQLETYIDRHPAFLTALTPLPLDQTAPPLARIMLAAASTARVGPMAAVAGAIAEYVGQGLLAAGADEVLVENGGDIFMHRQQDCVVKIFAGAATLSNKVALRIPKDRMPLGVCSSSGTVGHSLSLGCADAATVLARSTPLADAAATALGNRVHGPTDIDAALAAIQAIPGVLGAVVIHQDRLGAWGDVLLEPLD
jgi:ApbE superfamily uncharacterized protein (UPF0280 family)